MHVSAHTEDNSYMYKVLGIYLVVEYYNRLDNWREPMYICHIKGDAQVG